MDTLAERTRWVMEHRHLSQRAWSLRAKLSPSHVGQIARGQLTEPTGKHLAALAKAAGVSLHWLATGEGTPDPVASGEPAAELQVQHEPYLGDLPNWLELLAGARILEPDLPREIWDAVGRARVSLVPAENLTPSAIADLGRYTLRHRPPPKR